MVLVELVERVGLQDGTLRPNCWKLVEAATKEEKVLARRNANSMRTHTTVSWPFSSSTYPRTISRR